MYSQGQIFPVDGTSASAPIFAGLITLLNDGRLSIGAPTLGFINPFLYQAAKYPGVFNDILVGSNRCNEVGCCPYGFNVTTGWDAVTGLGTPNFPALYDLVMDF